MEYNALALLFGVQRFSFVSPPKAEALDSYFNFLIRINTPANTVTNTVNNVSSSFSFRLGTQNDLPVFRLTTVTTRIVYKKGLKTLTTRIVYKKGLKTSIDPILSYIQSL